MDSSIIKEELQGSISLKMANDLTLDDFCVQYITEYNRNRFEAFALRLFVGNESVITIYALDKLRQEDSNLKKGRLPVKKFKITTLPVTEILSYFCSFNCTVTNGAYDMEDMEVKNK